MQISKKQVVHAATVFSNMEEKLDNTKCTEPSFQRMQYFKKYLRPPKEQTLEQFRRLALKEKIIWSFCSHISKYIFMLILLLTLTFPEDTEMRYLQKTAIQNAIFGSNSHTKWMKPVQSRQILRNWFENNLLDRIYGNDECFGKNSECGLQASTQCIFVGNLVLRYFYCSDTMPVFMKNCKVSENESFESSDKFIYNYERRLLKGKYSTYYKENQWLSFSGKTSKMKQISNFEKWMNSTSVAVSLEFLLFNPTLSNFISVYYLFEITAVDVVVITEEISFLKIYDEIGYQYYSKFILNLIFLVVTLASIKKQMWNIIKKGLSSYWRQKLNYYTCSFISISVIYFIFYISYISAYKSILTKLAKTHLNSNVNTSEVATLESITRHLSGLLIFMHIVGSLRIFYFNYRLKVLLKRIISSETKILYIFFVFIFLALLKGLIKPLFGITNEISHSVFHFIKGIDFLLEDYRKPEVVNSDNMNNIVFCIFISFFIVGAHIYLLGIIRSVLINSDIDNTPKLENVKVKETIKVVKKRFFAHFDSKFPQIINKDDCMLPVEFLLLELERLAEKLLTKADNLFSEKSDKYRNDIKEIEGFLKSECELQLEKLNSQISSETKFYKSASKQNIVVACPEIKCENQIFKGLSATMPRPSKPKQNDMLSACLHSSLGSERKFKNHTNAETSLMLQQNRIRKTFPLSHVDSDPPSSESASENEKKDCNNGLSIRKTKSRGKGKNEDLNLNDLEDSVL